MAVVLLETECWKFNRDKQGDLSGVQTYDARAEESEPLYE